MIEEWRDIPGYEGLYEASNLGRIRTNANKVTSNARYPVRHWKQRIIKQHYMRSKRVNGERKDFRCTLWKDGEPYYYLVARLVAMAWCEGYADGMTVNHIDGNPENNRADNLEWLTQGDNNRHGFRTGLLGKNSIPTTIEINGKMVAFPSMSAASRALGKNNGYISGKLSKSKAKVF